MALTITASLVGRTAQFFYHDLFYNMPTVAGTMGPAGTAFRGGHVRVMEDVKSSEYLPIIDTLVSGYKADTTASSCDFSALGNYTITDKQISVCSIISEKEFCKKRFRDLFDRLGIFQMQAGSLADAPPEDVLSMLQMIDNGRKTTHLEILTWQGDPAGTPPVDPLVEDDNTLCTGYLTWFGADAAIPRVASPVTLTVANVKDEIGRLILAADELVQRENDINGTGRIFVSWRTYRLLMQAFAADYVNNPILTKEDNYWLYLNWVIVPTHGIPDNQMVLSYVDNLWLATDLVDDAMEVNIVDMQTTTADRKIRIQSGFKLGTQYFKSEYIALYGIAAP